MRRWVVLMFMTLSQSDGYIVTTVYGVTKTTGALKSSVKVGYDGVDRRLLAHRVGYRRL